MIPVDDENALNDWKYRNNEQPVPLREPIREAAKRLCEKSGICQHEVIRGCSPPPTSRAQAKVEHGAGFASRTLL